jgi:uncharacterized protein YjbI with pentapeptide repeats
MFSMTRLRDRIVDTFLAQARLELAHLGEANLSKANLSGTNLSGASSLWRADLPEANLNGAQGLSNEILEKRHVLSLKGATMPNGRKYEEWLKSKGSGEDGENTAS